jgi:hypothetical protein
MVKPLRGQVLRWRIAMDWMPVFAAVAMIVLGFGLFCLAAILTLATLWPYLSLAFRLAVLRTLAQLRLHLRETAIRHFYRIRRYGHTHWSAWIAVVCSVVIWLGIVVAFSFVTHWRTSIVILALLPLVFFAAGWRFKGEKAPKHKFRFACAFFEPAAALAVPTLTSKLIDLGLSVLVGAL